MGWDAPVLVYVFVRLEAKMFDMMALERLHQSTHPEQCHNTSLHQHGGIGIKGLDINHACKDELTIACKDELTIACKDELTIACKDELTPNIIHQT